MSRAAARTTGAPLNFETVIDEAQGLIRDAGFEALTMRRLAQRCGVTAMSLYRHVSTKEELLAVLADRLLDELNVPDLAGLTWEEEIAAVFRALHRMWLEHPEFGHIAASQPVDGKVAHRWMERVLAALERSGLTERQVVDAYDSLASYTTGSIQQHAGRKVRIVPAADRVARMRELSADDFPRVRAFAEALVNRSAEDHFEAGLALILRGISAQTTNKTPES